MRELIVTLEYPWSHGVSLWLKTLQNAVDAQMLSPLVFQKGSHDYCAGYCLATTRDQTSGWIKARLTRLGAMDIFQGQQPSFTIHYDRGIQLYCAVRPWGWKFVPTFPQPKI